MTDFVDARTGPAEVVAAIRELTGGGADVAFECTGLVSVMRQALDSCRPAWGTCVLIGVEPSGIEMSFPPVYVRYGRTIAGSYFGGVKGRSGLGRIVDLYLDGAIDVDALISHRIGLDDINRGFEMMASGEGLRTVVQFESLEIDGIYVWVTAYVLDLYLSIAEAVPKAARHESEDPGAEQRSDRGTSRPVGRAAHGSARSRRLQGTPQAQ